MNLEAEKMHRDCEPHNAEHCDINEHHNNAKNGFDAEADDCGHTMQSGHGVGIPKGGGHPVDGTVTAGLLRPVQRAIRTKIRSMDRA